MLPPNTVSVIIAFAAPVTENGGLRG